jgi:hypothetical protein
MERLDINNPPAIVSTASGEIDFNNPDPSQLKLEEISRALAKLNRYTGQSSQPISVAAHSILCATLAIDSGVRGRRTLKTILMHDAAESVLGDVNRPLKRAMGGAYDKFEENLERAMAEAFDLEFPFPPCVKVYDNLALACEVDWVTPQWRDRWAGLPDTDGVGGQIEAAFLGNVLTLNWLAQAEAFEYMYRRIDEGEFDER